MTNVRMCAQWVLTERSTSTGQYNNQLNYEYTELYATNADWIDLCPIVEHIDSKYSTCPPSEHVRLARANTPSAECNWIRQASEQTLFGVPPELLLLFHVRKDSIRNGTDRTNWTQTNIHYAIRSECVHSIDQVVIGNMIRVSSFPVVALIIHQSTLNFLQSIALARPVATELVSG